MRDQQRAGISWIYARVLRYCQLVASGVLGHFGQEPYKRMFFRIFMDASLAGFCGYQALMRLKRLRSKLKKKTLESREFVISAYRIEQNLRKSWLSGKKATRDQELMITELCAWWAEWEYA